MVKERLDWIRDEGEATVEFSEHEALLYTRK